MSGPTISGDSPAPGSRPADGRGSGRHIVRLTPVSCQRRSHRGCPCSSDLCIVQCQFLSVIMWVVARQSWTIVSVRISHQRYLLYPSQDRQQQPVTPAPLWAGWCCDSGQWPHCLGTDISRPWKVPPLKTVHRKQQEWLALSLCWCVIPGAV